MVGGVRGAWRAFVTTIPCGTLAPVGAESMAVRPSRPLVAVLAVPELNGALARLREGRTGPDLDGHEETRYAQRR
jgi:hypothetical protein